MNPLISVIVPVYNVEKYLDRCVTSIVEQTYENLEIILVDDGSPDNSGALCDEWAKKDSRIKVFHKENGGLSDARNYGTEKSVGEYITYIDSDDYVLPNYVEFLYNNLKKFKADISCCDFKIIYDTAKETSFKKNHTLNSIHCISGREACLRSLYYTNGVYFVISTCKLYKQSIVKEHKFPKSLLHEDEATTYRFLYNSANVCVSNKQLYGYYQNQSGITRNKTSQNSNDTFLIFYSRADFFKQNKDRELEIACWDALLSLFIYSNLDKKSRFCKAELEVIKEHWFSGDLSSKSKFKFLIYFISPKLYGMLIKIINKT